MKSRFKWILMACVALLLAGCQGAYTGTLVSSGEHQLTRGVVLPGDVLITAGVYRVQSDARVDGTIYMLGGELEILGQVGGDVTAVDGSVRLGPQARIDGALRMGGASLERDPQAQVAGGVVGGANLDLPIDAALQAERQPQLGQAVLQAILLALLAWPAASFLPRPLRRIRRAVVEHPLVSAALGALVFIVGLVLVVIMAFTLVLIPVSLLGVFAGFLGIGLGWVALGAGLGRRLAHRFDWHISLSWQAALGTFIFMLLLQLIVDYVPYVGSLLGLLAMAIALGALVLTRFGLSTYVPPRDEGELLVEETWDEVSARNK